MADPPVPPPPISVEELSSELRELSYALQSVSGYLLNILSQGDPELVSRFADDLHELGHEAGLKRKELGLSGDGEPNRHLLILSQGLRRSTVKPSLRLIDAHEADGGEADTQRLLAHPPCPYPPVDSGSSSSSR
jgi:hypothetical protein